jgi:hypothetical protein
MTSHLLLRGAMIASTWTEDRAMLGSNPSAVPGAETEGPGHRPGVPPDFKALRDQQQRDKPTVQPSKRLLIVQPTPSRSRRTSTESEETVLGAMHPVVLRDVDSYNWSNEAVHLPKIECLSIQPTLLRFKNAGLLLVVAISSSLLVTAAISNADLVDLASKLDPYVVAALVQRNGVSFPVTTDEVLALRGKVPGVVLEAAVRCAGRSAQPDS